MCCEGAYLLYLRLVWNTLVCRTYTYRKACMSKISYRRWFIKSVFSKRGVCLHLFITHFSQRESSDHFFFGAAGFYQHKRITLIKAYLLSTWMIFFWLNLDPLKPYNLWGLKTELTSLSSPLLSSTLVPPPPTQRCRILLTGFVSAPLCKEIEGYKYHKLHHKGDGRLTLLCQGMASAPPPPLSL